MFPVSQIIERNLVRRKPAGSALWINPEKDDCWRGLTTACASLTLFSQDFASYAFLRHMGANIDFAAFPGENDNRYDWIIMNLPRQKALLNMMLDCAARLLAPGGALWLAGENKAGIKSSGKLLKTHFMQTRKLDSARHCSLFEADTPVHQGSFEPRAYRDSWRLECDDSRIEVVSYPGVFAHGRLDDGTALLLRTLSTIEPEGDVLDFACGAGVIGSCIAARHTKTSLTFLDTNALALRACAETIEANELDGAILASDGLSELNDTFDIVVSNPPIHAGTRTDTRLGIRLLESIQEHIRPGGKLVLVANVHLPYENWLRSCFKRVGELAANQNYKVIEATR